MSNIKLKWSKYIPIQPFPKQIAFLCLPHLEALYGGSAGGGKILYEDGVVLTPFGFKECSDLELGDAINNPDGSVSRISYLHPWSNHQVWRVHFHDGTHTDVAEEHLWKSWRSGKRKKINNQPVFGEDAAEIISTKELKEWTDKALQQQENNIRPNWACIPVAEPQRFNVTNRYPSEIDPYLLGMLLGDGYLSKDTVSITSEDHSHLVETLKQYYYSTDQRPGNKAASYYFIKNSFQTIRSQLSKLGLLGTKSDTKFVPRQFLYGSIETRLSVLQGLMDTDGTVDKRGHLSYCTTSLQLAKDVTFLVQSLGGTATLSTKTFDNPNHKDAFILYIKLRDEPSAFRLERKRLRCKEEQDLLYRRVVKVEVLNEVKRGRCITVAHPNGLYLTNDFIVTHNSEALLAGALQYVDQPKYSAILFRRTLTDLRLPDSLLSRARDWLGPFVASGEVKYVPSENHAFHFPSGAKLVFGYLDSSNDRYRYQSAQFQYVGFDEATQIRQEDIEYLYSRLRKTKDMVNIPLRLRMATNPGGISHQFIKDMFGIRLDTTTGRFRGTVKNKPFIPSFASENLHLDQNYKENLKRLGSVERARLLEGNWDSQESAIYSPTWFDRRYTIKNQTHVVLHEVDRPRVYQLKNLVRFACVDSASSERTGIEGHTYRENQSKSWSVCGVFGLVNEPPFDLLWLHNTRSQCKIPEFQDKVKIVYRKWQPQFIRLQDTTADRGIGQQLEHEGLPIKWVKDIKDKVSNSLSAQIRSERGHIWLPQEASWLRELESELYTWTGSPRDVDDQIDVLSSAGQEAALRGYGEERDSTLEIPTASSSPKAVCHPPKYICPL